MSGVIQTAYGVNSASLRAPPSRNSGIVVAMAATAAVDLSNSISLADNQGNTLSQAALYEFWDMVVGHQSLAIGFYGLLRQPSEPRGTYTVTVNGLPTGRNGGAANIALFEVNGLQSLDQSGFNGATAAVSSVATGTACQGVNSNPNDLVIAALGVQDPGAWMNAPRYPPVFDYTGIFSDVISPKGSGVFAAVQAAYKVVHAVETSTADWGSMTVAAGNAWPWVSAVASFSLAAASGRSSRRSLPAAGVAALAPLAWVIERRRRRALQRFS
jgi:hypothetical protein